MPELDAVRVRVLLERAYISVRLTADTDPRFGAWADRAAVILEQRRRDEDDCELAEYAGMELG